MSTRSVGGEWQWPIEKLTSLRLGQRLVTEVPASSPGRRAFVDIRPAITPADAEASRQGWKRADRARTFRLQHWEYDADRISGFDYDIGAVLINDATVTDEPELTTALETWQLHQTPPEKSRDPSTDLGYSSINRHQ